MLQIPAKSMGLDFLRAVLGNDDPFAPDLREADNDELERLARDLLCENIEDTQGTMTLVLGALRTMQRTNEALYNEANLDAMTGLYNRRAFETMLAREVARVSRYKVGTGLVYIDLDGFKPINDTYGHAAGDKALKTVGRVLANHVRASDAAARLGGDEFAVILVETASANCQIALQRLNKLFAELTFEWDGRILPIRASLGMVTYETGMSVRDMIRAADEKMYAIKHTKLMILDEDNKTAARERL